VQAGVVVGRERELERVRALLDVGAGGLVLEGEAGIGKTTLFEAALAVAREQGYAVTPSSVRSPRSSSPSRSRRRDP